MEDMLLAFQGYVDKERSGVVFRKSGEKADFLAAIRGGNVNKEEISNSMPSKRYI